MRQSKLEEQLSEIEQQIQKLKEENKVKESKEYEERLRRLGESSGPKSYTVSIYPGW